MIEDNVWLTPWPKKDCESVSACPICGNVGRTLLYRDLVDNVFFVAPGKWSLYKCIQCCSAYLDPRPTPESISKAYSTYYTHAIGSPITNVTQMGLLRRLRHSLANGYLNHRYGTKRRPAYVLGKWIFKLLPGQRHKLDARLRYLPKPVLGQRLLDIGCGNGEFLLNARDAGWDVLGIDTDPNAVNIARQRGFNVILGTANTLVEQSKKFDVITLNHVIEHVHNPKYLLQSVFQLLKPDGVVYIETPNIHSHGVNIYGKNWRGLEAPRHLILFNLYSLKKLLIECQFLSITTMKRKVHSDMYIKSARMSSGISPYSDDKVHLNISLRLRLMVAFAKTSRLEFITLLVRKRTGENT